MMKTFSAAFIAKVIKEISGNLYVYPGGTIAPLLQEAKKIGISILVSKSEQGAGYMALAEANLYHRPAFTAVTSGPGITNLVTVIADAYYDSIPLIVLSGQVGTADLDRNPNLRQRGFQEAPVTEILRPICKKTIQPRNAVEIATAISEAVATSMTGRKGPVLIDLPMNAQLEEISEMALQQFSLPSYNQTEQYHIDDNLLAQAARFLGDSAKPLILIGGGAQDDWKNIRHYLQYFPIPVISSLRGTGVVSSSQNIGWIGHTGTPWANAALYEADTILVLGSRLDIRQTGTEIDIFKSKKVIHVDIDKEELEHCRIAPTLKFHCSAKDFLSRIVEKIHIKDISNWQQRITELQKSLPLTDFSSKGEGLDPERVLSEINKIMKGKKAFVTTGVGSHQHWVSRYIDIDNEECRLFTSAGHGTMGFGLPTAIGLQYLNRNHLVLSIDGDGSFQMNIQELALVENYNLPVKILVLDNNRLAIVSQFQNIVFHDDPTTGNVKNPEFVKIAEAYGIKSFYMDNLDTNIIRQWIEYEGASFLQVKIKHDTPISPMLLGGQKLNDMWNYEQ